MCFRHKKPRIFPPGILLFSTDLILIVTLFLSLNKLPFCTAHLRIPALGRHAQLGHLYSELTDEIRGGSIFSSTALPPSAVETTNISRLTTKTAIVADKVEKFKFLGIDRNTAANILAGILTVEGSATLLDEEIRTEHDVTGLFLSKFKSATQRLLMYSKELNPIYNTAVLGHKEATHVITEITWGNTAVVSLADQKQLQSKPNLRNSLKAELKRLSSKLSPTEEDAKTNFSVTLTSDLALSIDLEPTRRQFKDIQNQVKAVAIQDMSNSESDSKVHGVPLEFTLTPIQVFRDYLDIQIVKGRVVQKLDTLTLDRAISVFDDISIAQLRLRNLEVQLMSQAKCLLPATKLLLKKRLTDYETFRDNFTINFQYALESDRLQSNSGGSTLSDLLEEYREAEFNSENINSKLVQFNTTLKKIQFCKLLDSYTQIEYVEMGQNLVSKALISAGKQIFVLFIKTEFQQNDNQAYEENVSTFFKLLYKPFNKLFILDCDFDFVECSAINNTVIKQYKNGNFTIEDVHRELRNFKMSESLEMKAVGRVAQLGELYDARTERFLGRSLFAGKIPEALLIKTEINTSVTNTIPSESYAGKFAALNIDPQLQLSILAEMFPLTRSGQYFADREFVSEHPVKSLVHQKRSENNEIKLLDPKTSEIIDGTVLNEGSATHIVIKVEFGINSVFSLSEKEINSITSHRATNTISTSPSDNTVSAMAYINLLKNYIQAITTNTTDPNLNSVFYDRPFSVNVYSDIQEEGSKPLTLTSIEELQKYFTNEFIPGINNPNEGKRHQISYVLYPIENLKKSLGLFSPHVFHHALDTKTIDIPELSRILNQVQLADSQIQKMSTALNENPDCTSENDLKTLKQIQAVYKVTLGLFRASLLEFLANIKKGEVEPSTLEKFLKDFQSSNYFGEDFQYKELLKLSHFENRFRLYRQLKGNHIQYLGRENDDVSFNELVAKIGSEFASFYVLYYKQSWVEDHGDIWRTCIQTFYSKLKESNNSIVKNGFVVDCEFSHPYCDNMTQPAIHEYKNGRISSLDYVLKVEQEESSINTKFEQIREALNATENQLSSMEDKVNALENGLDSKIKTESENAKTMITHLNRNLTRAIDGSKSEVVENIESKMATMKSTLTDSFTTSESRVIANIEGKMDTLKNNITENISFIKENFESKTNCSGNKCLNGGTCTNSNTGFSCACPSGFQGKQCEKQINFCESSPCQNNGFCQNGLNGYKCLCSKGFSGTNCVTSINECSSGRSPCQNGGRCIDEEDGFTCACRSSWTGQRCQAQLNACQEIVCQNGGACTNTLDYLDFDCNCKPGYRGKRCESDVDECSLNSALCQNEGVCQNTIGSYICVCATGFAGTNCEHDVRCGGTLNSDSGSINYKSDKIINQEEGCLWTVAAQHKNASHIVVSLMAARFVMNDRHFLSVGYFSNSDYKDGEFIWKRFGLQTRETIEVPTPVAFIHFVASGALDTGTANKGFALNFRSENRGSFNADNKYSNIFLTGPSGSRRYPLTGNYGNNERTAIVVQPTAQNSVLNVQWWDFESGFRDFLSIWILQSNFNYNKVELLWGRRDTSSPRRYNTTFSSRNDPFLLIFRSDRSAEYSGFEFSWGR